MTGRGQLVARLLRRVRVVDDVVDVGVLEQQRAPAGAVELVPERVHGRPVDVRDGPDRSHRHRSRRVAGAHRRARDQRLDGEVRDLAAAGRRGDHESAGARGGPLDEAEHRRRQPADGQRREQRRGLGGQSRQVGRRVHGLAKHLLDRRHQHDVVAVLADPLGDRPRVLERPERIGAVDRRAREPLGDAARVDRGPRHLDEDPRPLARLLHDVDHLDVERRDRRPLDHGLAGALHPGLHLGQRHDRSTALGQRGVRGQAQPSEHDADEKSEVQIVPFPAVRGPARRPQHTPG